MPARSPLSGRAHHPQAHRLHVIGSPDAQHSSAQSERKSLMAGVLDGVRVIDLSRGVSAACTRSLDLQARAWRLVHRDLERRGWRVASRPEAAMMITSSAPPRRHAAGGLSGRLVDQPFQNPATNAARPFMQQAASPVSQRIGSGPRPRPRQDPAVRPPAAPGWRPPRPGRCESRCPPAQACAQDSTCSAGSSLRLSGNQCLLGVEDPAGEQPVGAIEGPTSPGRK